VLRCPRIPGACPPPGAPAPARRPRTARHTLSTRMSAHSDGSVTAMRRRNTHSLRRVSRAFTHWKRGSHGMFQRGSPSLTAGYGTMRTTASQPGTTSRSVSRAAPACEALDGGVTRVGVGEVVEMRHHRHGCVSPWSTRLGKNRIGDAQRTMAPVDRDQPRDMKRPLCAAPTRPGARDSFVSAVVCHPGRKHEAVMELWEASRPIFDTRLPLVTPLCPLVHTGHRRQ
jgi:hypothetical protein